MNSSSWLTLASAAVAVLLAAVAAFQAALALGAPWGSAAYGGAHEGVLPSRLRVTSGVAAVVWVGTALVLLRRAGVAVPAPLPDSALGIAAWVALALFVVSVVLNAVTPSRLERAIWLPTTLLLALSTLIIALAPR